MLALKLITLLAILASLPVIFSDFLILLLAAARQLLTWWLILLIANKFASRICILHFAFRILAYLPGPIIINFHGLSLSTPSSLPSRRHRCSIGCILSTSNLNLNLKAKHRKRKSPDWLADWPTITDPPRVHSLPVIPDPDREMPSRWKLIIKWNKGEC